MLPYRRSVAKSVGESEDCKVGHFKHIRPVFGHLPEPNRAWLLVVYFSRQASQLSVYQSRDYHVYIPNTYQTRPVSCLFYVLILLFFAAPTLS